MNDPSTLLAFALGAVAGLVATAMASAGALRRRAHRAIEAERRAQAAERLAELGSMTSGLAHEIKNPLSTLTLNAQLLREEVLDAELPEGIRGTVARRVDALARESGRLKDILSDFLQFAGRMKLDPQPQDLRELLQQLSDFFHAQADRCGILLRLDVPGVPVVARVDAGLLKQALLNLAINAVQAMNPEGRSEPGDRRGELLLRLELDSTGQEARLSVIDSGPGIPEDRRGTIFRPYASTKPGGSGLGLATTRRIVEEHGGTISLFNGPDRGTCFTIRLPLGGPTVSPASPSP
ncbi:MAG: sensor histidine kinase [Planctomycetes bacterium]|nr:sensor histidine kinase [Planctomycetota bacterium]